MVDEAMKELSLRLLEESGRVFILAHLDQLGKITEDHLLMKFAVAFDLFLEHIRSVPPSTPIPPSPYHEKALKSALEGLQSLLDAASRPSDFQP